jgi:hypothetical protein
MSMKNSTTPLGIDPVTFWYVAHCLNHCATTCPVCLYVCVFIYTHMQESVFFFCLTRVPFWHWLAHNMVHALWMQSGVQRLWNRRFLSWMNLVLMNPSWIVTVMGLFCPPITACHFISISQMNGKICKERNVIQRSCLRILSQTQRNEDEIRCDTPFSYHRLLFLH